ncbi:amidase [Psychrobacter aestuarii]|uniref:Amidase n=1 Tax=Psychrobacter aestuarii TaxID=556327 RepID=A0ABN0VRB8_9GAMM|nr:amidase [Psychrobacter aestuarii]
MNDFTTVFPVSDVDSLTVAIKDSIDIAGTPTQLGSDACLNAPPAKKDATVVERLKQHHFSIVGKTVMHELAFGMTGVNRSYGTPVNPLYPNLIPGGSSSGSATAVASGQVAVAIGTDTGGSVRMPAACCGIYGFKPTFGLVSRAGVWPSASSLDCVGVFAAKPELITRTMQAIAPEFAPLSPADVALLEQDTLTLGWLSVDADTRITATIKAALTQHDATTTTATAHPRITLKPVECAGLDAAFQAGLSIINRETWLACKDFYATGKLGDDVATRLEKASRTTDSELLEAEYVRAIFSAQIDALLADTRVLALPTLPNAPMTLADALAGKTDVTASKLVRPFNLSGYPAYALPCHSDFDFPISLQLVGRKGDDAFVCALAERLTALLSPNLTTAAR